MRRPVALWLGKGEAGFEELQSLILEHYDEEEDDMVESAFMLAFGIDSMDPDFTEVEVGLGGRFDFLQDNTYLQGQRQQVTEDAERLSVRNADFVVSLYDFEYSGEVRTAEISGQTFTFIGNYPVETRYGRLLWE